MDCCLSVGPMKFQFRLAEAYPHGQGQILCFTLFLNSYKVCELSFACPQKLHSITEIIFLIQVNGIISQIVYFNYVISHICDF
jgi:hypothetical protein